LYSSPGFPRSCALFPLLRCPQVHFYEALQTAFFDLILSLFWYCVLRLLIPVNQHLLWADGIEALFFLRTPSFRGHALSIPKGTAPFFFFNSVLILVVAGI